MEQQYDFDMLTLTAEPSMFEKMDSMLLSVGVPAAIASYVTYALVVLIFIAAAYILVKILKMLFRAVGIMPKEQFGIVDKLKQLYNEKIRSKM